MLNLLQATKQLSAISSYSSRLLTNEEITGEIGVRRSYLTDQ
jgi:hypothetical protein